MEAENGFSVEGVFVRTYHNTLNDWLTREDESKVKADMKAQGWTQLSLTGDWEEMLRGAVRPTLRLPREKGETAALAAQLSETIGQVLASPATLKYSLSQEVCARSSSVTIWHVLSWAGPEVAGRPPESRKPTG